jgi:hypothetical protein
VLIGVYPMLENSGYTINDTLKSIGSAYFGKYKTICDFVYILKVNLQERVIVEDMPQHGHQ